ncbi:MAG: FAD-dependent oxidoreductase [Patescibacteria group bacterium]|jgi:hypothetical protein
MQRPRVAIIGAGIFGISCALELGETCQVTVYEQNSEIMRGGTYGNQYRHHFGYHYPRSPETVRQCQEAEKDFVDLWGEAIIGDFPAYYAIATEGSKITAEQFFAFCESQKLPYEISYPSRDFLDRSHVETCVKTKEPVYNYSRLCKLASDKILSNPHIQVKTGNTVVGCEFSKVDDTKIVFVKTAQGDTYHDSFDFVINATYANHNQFCNWLGFAVPPIEFRLKELVVVELPKPKFLAVTVMDGPFVTLVPMGKEGRYTLGDVARSLHDVKISNDGPPWSKADIAGRVSRFPEMQENDPFFIPAIKDAKYIQSIYSILPIRPNSDATDERITSVTNHGRGCWSVFEGKIITCVTAAKTIKRNLQM